MIPVLWNKESGAMRMGGIVLIAAIVLTGCAHMDINKNISALNRVQAGDTKEAVFNAMGPPDLRNDITDRRFVAFYRTKAGKSPGAPVTMAMCTPVSFENGRVVAVGDDMTEAWTLEKEALQRRAEKAERQRQEAEKVEAARRRAEAERQKKIRAIEKKVRPVPASNASLNLKLYRQLLELDPHNPRYRKKVALYEERLGRQEKTRQERMIRAAREKQRQTWEQARETRNTRLRQYTGNGTAEIAVHDMGNGSLYVWVKNVSGQIITTHPDYFTLVDSDGNKIELRISDTLDSVLEPGSISHGRIEFNGEVLPRELIFENPEAGRVSKSFQ